MGVSFADTGRVRPWPPMASQTQLASDVIGFWLPIWCNLSLILTKELGRPAYSGEGHLFIGLAVRPISLRGSPWRLSELPLEAMLGP